MSINPSPVSFWFYTARRLLSAMVFVAMLSVSCGQTLEKKALNSSAETPELRWKFETGG